MSQPPIRKRRKRKEGKVWKSLLRDQLFTSEDESGFRSSSDWDNYGTGDRLLVQNGSPENLISIPLTQAEADMTSDW